MSAAVEVHRPSGFFSSSGGYEYPAFLGLVATGLGLAGPGRFSVDHATGNRLNTPAVVLGAFAASAAAASVVLRRRAQVVAAQAAAKADAAGADESGADEAAAEAAAELP
jgi:putative oxidoreductase